MSDMKTLVGFILKSPMLDGVDVTLVKSFVKTLTIQHVNVVMHVNQALKDQVDLESTIIYLYNKYHRLKYMKESEKDRIWYGLVKVNGSRSPDNHLDPLFVTTDMEYIEYISLSDTFQQIQKLVQDRQKKLEQLSVNYRKELPNETNYS